MELDGKGIDPAYEFEYLGWWVNADGDNRVGLERRLEAAAVRYRSMGKLWYSADLGVSLKLRLYGAGVVSVLAYGCEPEC